MQLAGKPSVVSLLNPDLINWRQEMDGDALSSPCIRSDRPYSSPDLAPVINIQSVKRNYLGKPYTDCVNTYSTNNYSYLYVKNPPKIYSGTKSIFVELSPRFLSLFLPQNDFLSNNSDSNCIMNELMNIICQSCNCFPSYLNAVYDIKSKYQE